MAALLTHLAFYAGWPNAWAAFPVAKEVYADATDADGRGGFFGLGEPNDAYAAIPSRAVDLNVLSKPGEYACHLATSHSEPGCRNFWHIHHAAQGGGCTLMRRRWRGWYQEEGKAHRRALTPGDIVDLRRRHTRRTVL